MQAYFLGERESCVFRGRHLWSSHWGRLGRVEITTLRVGIGTKEGGGGGGGENTLPEEMSAVQATFEKSALDPQSINKTIGYQRLL